MVLDATWAPTLLILGYLTLVAARGILARRRARRLPFTPAVEVIALAACCALLVAFPTALGLRAGIALLFALALLALAVAWLVEGGPPEGRRLLSPVVLFALAFVVVLGPRAVLLASGDPGRFFVIDGSTGTTRSAFVAPPEARREPGHSAVRNPSVEGTTRDWGAPVSNAEKGFSGTLSRVSSDGYEGTSSAEARVRTGTGGSFISVAVGDGLEAKADVRPGQLVSAALAVKAPGRRPVGRIALKVAYYGADTRFIVDKRVSGLGAVPARRSPDRWIRLYGTSRVPRGAVYANPVAVVRGYQDRVALRFRLDAARLIPGARSPTDFPADVPPIDGTAVWRDAALRALAVALAMLLAVFAGYLLPLGAPLARRLPPFQLEGLRDPRTRTVLLALAGVGVVAYVVEMATYGGYRGYLASFSADPTESLGRFYIRMFATLATGAAVVLLVHRIAGGRREPFRPLEVAIVAIGLGIAVSYWLKAMIVIPLLTVLLVLHFARRGAAVWLGVCGVVLALITPFVYQVRSAGGVRPSDLIASAYWSEFLTNLQSRFFHFESLMIVIPYANRGHPWDPMAEFVGTAIPRVVWDDKPLSLNAQFTEQYLHGGLHARSDVGVVSLPGEIWLIGGWAGVIVVGVAIGVLLRSIQAMLAEPAREAGTLLLAVTALTWLLFTNDGWGLASSAITVVMLAVGWLAPLTRVPWTDSAEPIRLQDFRTTRAVARRSQAGP
jgi:hypothetical protein